ncbi:MAG: NAD(P)-dependent alcohol dehydrogenase [Candidatus Thorarchaeota archaeon]
MKAIVTTKYGPPEVLQILEIKKPTPKENEVLVKVHASTVTKYDCWSRSATAPPGFGLLMRLATGVRKPRQPILGTEFSGEVEAVGKDVTLFNIGDNVVGYTGMSMGAYSEYISMPEDAVLVRKPDNLTFEEATAVQGALTALYFLRKVNIQSGQKILIFGASGGVGNFAVQLAKHFGAEVHGVCSSSKVDWVKSLGADVVIDYTKEDFTKRGETYDIIFDTVGKSPFSGSVKSLKEEGIYLFVTYGIPRILRVLWLNRRSSKKGMSGLLEETPEDLEFLLELIDSGKIKSVIDKTYPMQKVVEAHRYVESGKKRGSVVITLDHL